MSLRTQYSAQLYINNYQTLYTCKLFADDCILYETICIPDDSNKDFRLGCKVVNEIDNVFILFCNESL